LHEGGVGGYHAVGGVIILEFPEIVAIVTHQTNIWNDRSIVKWGLYT
jgi:hypothetical protein